MKRAADIITVFVPAKKDAAISCCCISSVTILRSCLTKKLRSAIKVLAETDVTLRRYGGVRRIPIGAVDSWLKSTKVDIEILLAAVASKGTRVTGSGISEKKKWRKREREWMTDWEGKRKAGKIKGGSFNNGTNRRYWASRSWYFLKAAGKVPLVQCCRQYLPITVK